MSKTTELLNLVKAGARSNKYRIIFPFFSEDIDILCNSTSSPGREMGTTEIFLKGRKFNIAGDMSDDGTWEFTIYNTPDLLVRRFFLKVVGGIQNFQTPETIEASFEGASNLTPVYGGLNNSNLGTVGGVIDSGILDVIGLGGVGDAISSINGAYQDMKSNWNTIKALPTTVTNSLENGFSLVTNINSNNPYANRPWYMSDVKIQQLDHNDEVISETLLNNAFITSVSPIEYNDELGEISTTTLTFTYSGIEYGNEREIRVIEKY